MEDLEDAKDKVLMGAERRSVVISEEDKRVKKDFEAARKALSAKVDELTETVSGHTELLADHSQQLAVQSAELADQRTRKIMAPIQVPEGSGIDAGTVNVAHLQMQWSHSKLKPLEDDLCRVVGERSELEADLARRKQQEQRSGGSSSKQERSNSQRNHGGALRQI